MAVYHDPNANGLTQTTEGTLMKSTGGQRGLEGGVDKEDLLIPRAQLVQALSPEITDRELKKLYPNLTVGSIINSLTKEPLGECFVPVFMFKNYARFNPRKKDDPAYNKNLEPGAMIWRSNDPLDKRVQEETKFGPNGEPPAAITFMNFFSYFPGSPMPIIISFSKTSYKTGKQLLSLAKFGGGDLFSRRYRIFSDMETNDIGTYAVFKIQPAGQASPNEYATCERLWNDFSGKAKEIKVHDEDESTVAADNPDDHTATAKKPW